MPLAEIRFSRWADSGVHNPQKEVLVGAIPAIIAGALSCTDEGGQLEPEHVEVRLNAQGQFDANHYDISLMVTANDFPSRRANLDDRRKKIQDSFASLLISSNIGLRNVRICVWVLLVSGSFGDERIFISS